LLSEGFGPGFNEPLLVVAELPGPGRLDTIRPLIEGLAGTPGVAVVAPPRLNATADVAAIAVFSEYPPKDHRADELIGTLRNELIPATTATTGVRAYVAGLTPLFYDMSKVLGSRTPVVVAGVLALSFLLLMAVFRSVLVPLKAVIMNLLSIGAAYGVVVAVFQWGWVRGVAGIDTIGPIESFIPIILFAILFGLSMDYEVFLLSRIRERYLETGDNSGAVADGLASTARVITAAAVIMVALFSSFVLGDERIIKLIGFGLAVAILVDATLVRMLLVPATMELLGRANWWLPRWLGAVLPTVNVEESPTVTSVAPSGPAPPPASVGDGAGGQRRA
jgi:RND superfamily putative drug exporter